MRCKILAMLCLARFKVLAFERQISKNLKTLDPVCACVHAYVSCVVRASVRSCVMRDAHLPQILPSGASVTALPWPSSSVRLNLNTKAFKFQGPKPVSMWMQRLAFFLKAILAAHAVFHWSNAAKTLACSRCTATMSSRASLRLFSRATSTHAFHVLQTRATALFRILPTACFSKALRRRAEKALRCHRPSARPLRPCCLRTCAFFN